MHHFNQYESSDAITRYAHLNGVAADIDTDVSGALSPEDEAFLDRQEERRQLALAMVDNTDITDQDDLWLRCKEIDKPESQPVGSDFEQLLFNE